MISPKILVLAQILLIILTVKPTTTTAATAATFKCTANTTATCKALIEYVSPNTTTITAVKKLFNIKNLRTLLGANNLSLSTPANYTVTAKQKIVIPFPCICSNGVGISNNLPVYKVVKDDGLDHIATSVFSGLVNYTQIMVANNITNPDLIQIGQELKIPLPCSCDDVDGMKVVHYGHIVDVGSSIELIASRFNVTNTTLLTVNGINDPKTLLAGAVLDVPLKACSSSIGNSSEDYPLLVSNGTYIFTANNCVMCKCDYANNWTLQCEPSQLVASNMSSTCGAIRCEGTNNLYLGNTTSTGCNSTTCAYAGYAKQTILTTLAAQSTCPASSALRVTQNGSKWSYILLSVQLVVVCIHFLL